ncbi:MAG: AAA family ATPase [Bryobacteraceae bacterium]
MSFVDKFSPKDWSSLVGQSHVVEFFKLLLKSPDNYPKNIILNGPWGAGKTSTARIFASELNKIEPTHIYEYDVSIFNKDVIKEIKNKIDNQYSFSKDYRVLIFDEIQSANQSSQTLFLKTLENNIIGDNKNRKIFFLFLTTDSSKLIDPIISRCIELNFFYISDKDVKDRLLYILKQENLIVEDRILDKIVKFSGGHLRDSIKLLEKYILIKDEKTLFYDTKHLLNGYLYNNIDNLDKITVYPVNILLRDLKDLVTEYIDNNIDNNYVLTMQYLEVFLKFKSYISSIEDFVNVLKILKKFISSKVKNVN